MACVLILNVVLHVLKLLSCVDITVKECNCPSWCTRGNNKSFVPHGRPRLFCSAQWLLAWFLEIKSIKDFQGQIDHPCWRCWCLLSPQFSKISYFFEIICIIALQSLSKCFIAKLAVSLSKICLHNETQRGIELCIAFLAIVKLSILKIPSVLSSLRGHQQGLSFWSTVLSVVLCQWKCQDTSRRMRTSSNRHRWDG